VSAAANARRWGYHTLDPRAARRIVAAAGIHPGDLVVDLGAGSGALTAPLVAAGARVVAAELHPRRAAQLRQRFRCGESGPDVSRPVVEIRQGDLRTTPLPRTPYRVVANPPWSMVEELRDRLLRSPSLVRADLVIPRWVARKWAARYPRITVGLSVPSSAFRPSAPTGAAVAVITGRHR
jgi:23S rRNA (adenine-N6)-dimethyltransferase